MRSLEQLQSELSDQPDLRLVTITVDPDYDTPPVLCAYARAHGADPKRWFFLTGQPDYIYRLLQDGFKAGAGQNEGTARTPGNEAFHSTRLVVVDRQGFIREYFEGRQMDQEGKPVNDLPRLKQALLTLLRDRP